MHQFEIKRLFEVTFFGFSFNITNSTLCLLVVLSIALMIGIWLRLAKHDKTPNFPFFVMESLYNFTNKILEENISGNGVKKYLPFVFSVFFLILVSNIIGLLPYSFTATSHVALNFALSMMVFLLTLGITILKHGIFIHRAFIPHGTPTPLKPVLFVLEIFSYLTRPFSLSIRLAANMMAGHVMLDIIAAFGIAMKWFGIFPFISMCVIMCFELFVAFLQSYVFAVFTCVYINQALHH